MAPREFSNISSKQWQILYGLLLLFEKVLLGAIKHYEMQFELYNKRLHHTYKRRHVFTYL